MSLRNEEAAFRTTLARHTSRSFHATPHCFKPLCKRSSRRSLSCSFTHFHRSFSRFVGVFGACSFVSRCTVQLRDVVWLDESFFWLREQPNHVSQLSFHSRSSWRMQGIAVSFPVLTVSVKSSFHCISCCFSVFLLQLMSLSAIHFQGFGCRAAFQRSTRTAAIDSVTDGDPARSDGLWHHGRS